MPDESPGARWYVVGITQTSRVNRAGNFEDVYEYVVDSAAGVTFKVQVPVAVHSEEVARGMIEAEYASLERGAQLSG